MERKPVKKHNERRNWKRSSDLPKGANRIKDPRYDYEVWVHHIRFLRCKVDVKINGPHYEVWQTDLPFCEVRVVANQSPGYYIAEGHYTKDFYEAAKAAIRRNMPETESTRNEYAAIFARHQNTFEALDVVMGIFHAEEKKVRHDKTRSHR